MHRNQVIYPHIYSAVVLPVAAPSTPPVLFRQLSQVTNNLDSQRANQQAYEQAYLELLTLSFKYLAPAFAHQFTRWQSVVHAYSLPVRVQHYQANPECIFTDMAQLLRENREAQRQQCQQRVRL